MADTGDFLEGVNPPTATTEGATDFQSALSTDRNQYILPATFQSRSIQGFCLIHVFAAWSYTGQTVADGVRLFRSLTTVGTNDQGYIAWNAVTTHESTPVTNVFQLDNTTNVPSCTVQYIQSSGGSHGGAFSPVQFGDPSDVWTSTDNGGGWLGTYTDPALFPGGYYYDTTTISATVQRSYVAGSTPAGDCGVDITATLGDELDFTTFVTPVRNSIASATFAGLSWGAGTNYDQSASFWGNDNFDPNGDFASVEGVSLSTCNFSLWDGAVRSGSTGGGPTAYSYGSFDLNTGPSPGFGSWSGRKSQVQFLTAGTYTITTYDRMSSGTDIVRSIAFGSALVNDIVDLPLPDYPTLFVPTYTGTPFKVGTFVQLTTP